jgi:hypothetical protein
VDHAQNQCLLSFDTIDDTAVADRYDVLLVRLQEKVWHQYAIRTNSARSGPHFSPKRTRFELGVLLALDGSAVNAFHGLTGQRFLIAPSDVPP